MAISPAMAGRLRRRLQRHRRRLQSELEALRARGLGESLRESTGELATYDQHTADLGSETFERSKDLALVERAALTLEEVEQALRRLEQGRYGTCESCGAFIGCGRLLALPYARRCAACQQRHDEQEQERRIESRPVGHRPLEEAVLLPPFGRGNEPQAREDPGLHREDIWQMVAAHGNANTPQDLPGAVDYDEMWEGADTDHAGGVEEVEFVPDLRGTGVVDPEQVYPDPSGPGRRRPQPAEEGEGPDTP